MTVCCEASSQSNLQPRRFFPTVTEQMLTEQLNTGAQEPRVLNIYRNYLFTTQENQLLAFDSFRVITSFEKLPNFRCRRWHFHSPISKFNSNTLLIVQYFKFELCSCQFNHFVWLTLLNLQASVLPGE